MAVLASQALVRIAPEDHPHTNHMVSHYGNKVTSCSEIYLQPSKSFSTMMRFVVSDQALYSMLWVQPHFRVIPLDIYVQHVFGYSYLGFAYDISHAAQS